MKYKRYIIDIEKNNYENQTTLKSSKLTKKFTVNDNNEYEELNHKENNDSINNNLDNSEKNKESQNKKIGLVKSKIQKIQKKIKDRLKNKEKNKFDYFFMICVTTIIGNIGKYWLNILLDKILSRYEFLNSDEKLKHKYFFYFIFGIYLLSIMLSIILYYIFISIFTNDEKEIKKGNEYRICQFCGYIIYS